mmetsp:Transcript_119677/g.186906  ORF Transcript_119677/g.186906 Transcript_119677/m.186906 type:complete len:80 (+) Transcript_119677:35-274(+)
MKPISKSYMRELSQGLHRCRCNLLHANTTHEVEALKTSTTCRLPQSKTFRICNLAVLVGSCKNAKPLWSDCTTLAMFMP